MTFQEKLTRLAEDLNKSKIGRRAGLGPAAISNYIRRGRIPRADVALRICRALGVNPEWMMDDTFGWPPIWSDATRGPAPARHPRAA